MSEYSLYATAVMATGTMQWEPLTVSELNHRSLWSIAARLGDRDALATTFQSHFGLSLPNVQAATLSGPLCVRWSAPQQWFLSVDAHERGDRPSIADVTTTLSDYASVTEQSDGWMALSIAGDATLATLELLCPVDLSPRTFPIRKSIRTVVEHLGVQITRLPDAFEILTPRSSGRSFVHALETAATSVCGPRTDQS
ncbi:MAG: sarcosine oxidase subunit gamma family protein [Pseudomonadota bacterium]